MQRYITIAVLLTTTATACRRSDREPPTGPAGPPEVIGIVSGNAQLGAVDRPLLESFVVRVTDRDGNPVQGVTVNWSVASGGGTLAATTTTTAVDGTASTLLTLGPSEGQNSALGSFTKASGSTGGVTFSAEGLVPVSLALASGDGQTARFNQPLAEPLRAAVRAADGRGVPGYPVDWAVTGGGGSLSNSVSLSDAMGGAAADLTVGSTADTTTVEAAATGLSGSPVQFQATATPPVSVTVIMQNLAFNAPGGGDAVTILLGDTVRWLNRDGVEHTATSSATPEGGLSFDSPVLNLNDTFEFVANVRGVWTYFCRLHPEIMRDATITVN